MSKTVMRCQRRKKLQAIEAFGGKCQICGYDKCPNALEFHHIEGKKEKPSYVIMRWKWERAKEELKKCILVCANCHRELHYKAIDFNISNYVVDWIAKNCENCNTQFETKSLNQRFCCIACSQFANRKVKRPTKEELQNLLQDRVPFSTLGKMFGVSDNAVRKWAKRYKLIE